MASASFAKVIIDLPSQEIDRPFDYAIPSDMRPKVDIGSMVLVKFGRALQVGYVIGLTSETFVASPSSILEVLEDNLVFDREMLQLCQWIAGYYLSTLGQALKLALPPGRGRRLYQCLSLNGTLDEVLAKASTISRHQQEVLLRIDENGGKMLFSELRKSFGKSVSSTLRTLEKKGLVARKYTMSEPRVNIKREEYARLEVPAAEAQSMVDKLAMKSPKQAAILHFLSGQALASTYELLLSTGASRQSLRLLTKKGLVSTYLDSTYREPDFYYPEEVSRENVLTDEQNKAVQTIKDSLNRNESKVFLLQGITGSGKTEIYIQVIEDVLKAGKTAIVLVPEIALTPQIANRFRSVFSDRVAVLHSGLGAGERFDQWRRVREGKYKVVVGARSALFAPLDNLGLIVVDEEHEVSYKQNKSPRYNATVVALKRAEINRCPVILGSATPAIESRYKAERGEYARIILEKRIKDRKLPATLVVDMREELKQGNKSIFSLALQREMNSCLDEGGKFILFLNRRGYSSFLLCRDCGFVPKCKRCAVSLTYHQDKTGLKCHHCNYHLGVSRICPNCGGTHLRHFGVGTQKVEDELNKLIPGLSVVRMDTDTTAGRDAHRKKLIEFKEKKRGVLLGTQMIAKGLDFPEVTLVGVINADTALNLPDFRAAERTFQVLMQVSGRAGRGAQPGKVVVQTYLPDNYAIAALLNGKYDDFYKQEVSLRRELNYPPFCQLVNILISGKDEAKVEALACEITEFICAAGQKDIVSVLGPAQAPLSRIKNRFRWHIVLKVSDMKAVAEFLRESSRQLNLRDSKEETSVTVDIDPVWML